MEGPLEQVFDHPKSFGFIATGSGFTYDSPAGLDCPSLQYPHPEAFGMPSIHPSPHPGFPVLNLAAPMAEHTYSSSYITGSPGHPFTPPDSLNPTAWMSLSAGEMTSDSTPGRTNCRGSGSHSPSLSSVSRSSGHPFTPSHSLNPTARTSLSAGEMTSDSTPGHTNHCGSGSHSPSLSSVSRSVRYNPISVSPVVGSGRERKRRLSKDDNFDNFDFDFDDFAPSSAPTASNKAHREEIRRQRIELDQRRHDGLSVERSRHEEIRRQRIELDQRRHDGLRGGYRRLEGALPVSNRMLSYHRLEGALAVSNRMLSNVSLLDRATAYIKHLEMAQRLLQTRLQQAENETTHLRQINDAVATVQLIQQLSF